MNRCERGAENVPEGMYYDCINDVFRYIPNNDDYIKGLQIIISTIICAIIFTFIIEKFIRT